MLSGVSPLGGESTSGPKIHGLVLTVVSSALCGTVPGGLVSSMVEPPPPLQLISVIATNAAANNKRITFIWALHLANLFFALRLSGPTILALNSLRHQLRRSVFGGLCGRASSLRRCTSTPLPLALCTCT